MSEYYEKFTTLTREQKKRLYEIENDNSFDDAEEICCPYCNTPQDRLDSQDLGYEDESETGCTCDNPDCGKEFTISTRVSYSWSTQVPDEEAMKIFEMEQSKRLTN